MDKRVIYYEDNRGKKPVKEFIDSFDSKTKGKTLARLDFLEKHWHEARRPFVDKIDKDLYELRVEFAWNNIRIIYAYMFRDHIVLLHGLQKKTKKIPENDKLKARNRMIDFQIRYNEGRIVLRKGDD
ncbi:MAG: type II toxin-antitoxin system RelE/ParE family toxin [Candidatus Omnitrophica bacterium]|nr:type II toxin-antitoxin system RelE/ParE family toxin [Candidatus Omnitrophota bacterium]MBU4458257.1 type II toxin-antitoxin system RelE/ParE family toxin [Candidatus Omnitrophota bacterium]